jgi:hypothetical protein
MVRPWRAASRFNWAMTVASMLRVVFIWNTISDIWLYVKSQAKLSGTINKSAYALD